MVYDSNLQFRSTTDSLTATETSATVTVWGARNMSVVIDVPKKSTGDTMQPTVQVSTDGTTWSDHLVIETVASVTAGGNPGNPFKIIRQLDFHGNKYSRLVTTVAGTSPDFGAVQARLTTALAQNRLGVGQNATSNPV